MKLLSLLQPTPTHLPPARSSKRQKHINIHLSHIFRRCVTVGTAILNERERERVCVCVCVSKTDAGK